MIALLFLQLILAFLILAFLKNKPKLVLSVSLLSALLNVLLCGAAFKEFWLQGFVWKVAWVQFASLNFGIALGKFELLMLLLVALIAFLVTIFSYAYMRNDKNFHLYFAYLLLFVFAMQMLVLSENLLQTYIFWELVGFCSYLLIGFWREKSEAVKASRKAFLVNRVGDVGFLIGIFLVFGQFHTLSFAEIEILLAQKNVSTALLSLIGICIFLGAMAKSAQVPLHVWLPDAMQGPTPISALLHAATMVAAGVFLVGKIFFLLTPWALQFVQIVGLASMLLGAYKALFQSNIKKVLAYSTISQLGLMFLAIGTGNREAGLFHLFTHAFFKAGLFLCAGVVLHHTHHFAEKVHTDSENMYLLGGLRKKMSWLFAFYTIFMASLLGLPFTAGFLSKEMILDSLWHNATTPFQVFVFALALVGFGLTAFYIAQQYRALFFGKFHLQTFFPNLNFHFEKPIFSFAFPLSLLALGSFWIVFSFNPFSVKNAWISEILIFSEKQSPVYLPFLALSVTLLGFWIGFQKQAAFEAKKRLFSQKLFVWQLQIFRFSKVFVRKILLTGLATIKVFQSSAQVAQIVVIFAQKLHKLEKFWNRFLNNLAKLQVVLAHIIHWTDRALIDGFLHFLLWIGRSFGNFVRNLQGKEIQSYWFFTLLVLIVILYWIAS
ncbi:NADH-quinone oxidoreductase subunit 5 family protein [Raineya sp.]|jgi:NADH-quinone oxidoreductase subunit L